MGLELPKLSIADLTFRHNFKDRDGNPSDNWKKYRYQTIYASGTGPDTYIRDNPHNGEPIHETIGHMMWETDSGALHWITTHPAFQRRGVATAMFSVARSLAKKHGLPDIHHTGVRYPAGTEWAKSTGLPVPPIASGVCRDCGTLRAVSGACNCTPDHFDMRW